MVVYTLYKMISPWQRRRHWWEAAYQVWISPFGRIDFFTLYVANMMTSFNRITASLMESICYIASGDFFVDHKPGAPPPQAHFSPHCGPTSLTARYLTPIVLILPLWWRMFQSLRGYYVTQKRWPHMANAVSYSLSSSVVLFGIFNPFYLSHYSAPESHMIAFQAIWIVLFVASALYSCKSSSI